VTDDFVDPYVDPESRIPRNQLGITHAYTHGYEIEWPSDAAANDDASAYMMRNQFDPMRTLLEPCIRRAE
jgi:hypothetical protein